MLCKYKLLYRIATVPWLDGFVIGPLGTWKSELEIVESAVKEEAGIDFSYVEICANCKELCMHVCNVQNVFDNNWLRNTCATGIY